MGTGSIPIIVQLLVHVRSIEYFMAFYVQSRIILVSGEHEFVIQNHNAIGTLGRLIDHWFACSKTTAHSAWQAVYGLNVFVSGTQL